MKTVMPSAEHTHTIINLHGRDSEVDEYCEEFFESEDSSGQILLAALPNIKWVFPSAPRIQSERFGTDMSQWFDMWDTNSPRERCGKRQLAQLKDSISIISQITREEAAIGGAHRVILCRIGQGAATALATLLEIDQPLCAFAAFSTWMSGCVTLDKASRSLQTPIFLAHCDDDDVIDVKYGQGLKDSLEECGVTPEFHRYP